MKYLVLFLLTVLSCAYCNGQSIETTTTVVNTSAGFKATTSDFSGSITTLVTVDGLSIITNTVTMDNTGQLLATSQTIVDYPTETECTFIMLGLRIGWNNEAKK